MQFFRFIWKIQIPCLKDFEWLVGALYNPLQPLISERIVSNWSNYWYSRYLQKRDIARENLTKISDSLPEGHLVICGCSIETVYGPEFRKVGFKLIQPSVFLPNFHVLCRVFVDIVNTNGPINFKLFFRQGISIFQIWAKKGRGPAHPDARTAPKNVCNGWIPF